jgi:hypothetical protein
MSQQLQPFAYFTTDGNGVLKVIGTTAAAALPAGTIKKDGLAYHPDGSLYVIFG